MYEFSEFLYTIILKFLNDDSANAARSAGAGTQRFIGTCLATATCLLHVWCLVHALKFSGLIIILYDSAKLLICVRTIEELLCSTYSITGYFSTSVPVTGIYALSFLLSSCSIKWLLQSFSAVRKACQYFLISTL